jgi:hypothetical protein
MDLTLNTRIQRAPNLLGNDEILNYSEVVRTFLEWFRFAMFVVPE